MNSQDHTYLSWGRAHRFRHKVYPIHWLTELPADLRRLDSSVLAYGKGRSYGDCCLNENQALVDTSALRRFVKFDNESGRLTCEAGVTVADILRVFLPRGYFPPVVPGTKHVTVGGAIANDVHGKNHHQAGTFGKFVEEFCLLRSDGEELICSAQQNNDLFRATIGGMGLTGIIKWATIRLKPITSAKIAFENIKFTSLEEFVELSASSAENFEYTVAWIDTTARGKQLGRGIFMRGNHVTQDGGLNLRPHLIDERDTWSIPFAPPINTMQDPVVRLLNTAYFNKQVKGRSSGQQSYDQYFFPLDKLSNWNVMYGPRGFFQYQFVIDHGQIELLKKVLRLCQQAHAGSFVSVLKAFGDVKSPGIMSFPKPGFTLTLDIPNQGSRTKNLFRQFEDLLSQAGGRVYAAKDAVASPQFFMQGYPEAETFRQYIDPKFSSSLWRRINDGQA